MCGCKPGFRRWVAGLLVVLAYAAAAEAQVYRAKVNGTDRYNVVLTDDTPQQPGARLQLTPLDSAYDECQRTWYLDGQITQTAGTQTGTFSGNMTRCTTKSLKDECDRQRKPIGPNYDKPASGTFETKPGVGLVLTVNWQAEKWNQTDCKFEKQDRGTDVILITSVTTGDTHDPRTPTIRDLIRGATYGVGGGSPMRP